MACVFMCVWCEQQDGGRAASKKSSFPSIIWKHSLFPNCWLCLFSATQTLLGNGFSCQKSVINTATGCGLNNRLMVIFLKGQRAHGLCHQRYVPFIIPKWKRPVKVRFSFLFHRAFVVHLPPCICGLILESECAWGRSE